MVWTTPKKANASIQKLLDRVLKTGSMSSLDHIQLTSALLSDQCLASDERHQISLLFDQVKSGRIKIQG
jgi:hypothetical protein